MLVEVSMICKKDWSVDFYAFSYVVIIYFNFFVLECITRLWANKMVKTLLQYRGVALMYRMPSLCKRFWSQTISSSYCKGKVFNFSQRACNYDLSLRCPGDGSVDEKDTIACGQTCDHHGCMPSRSNERMLESYCWE